MYISPEYAEAPSLACLQEIRVHAYITTRTTKSHSPCLRKHESKSPQRHKNVHKYASLRTET